MKESRLKYIFYLCSAILLFLMLLNSRDAGVTCDEVLHYNHSVSVYNYFASHGADKSALNTPVTHLQYYGQSYDNFVTIIIKWFHIDDIYGFRHVMSVIAGWLVILCTALFALWPGFIGHTVNNLKDIPFALGYIASIFFILKFLVSERKISAVELILL